MSDVKTNKTIDPIELDIKNPVVERKLSEDEKHEYIIKRSKINYNNENEDGKIDFNSKILQHPGS